MKKKVNNYRRGRIAEKKVLNRQKELGWENLVRSKGSRGPWDIRGRTRKGKKAYIQVKSYSSNLSKKEAEKLKKYAKKHGGIAAFVKYLGRGKMKFKLLGNWG